MTNEKFANNLRCLILETNQLIKINEIFGKNFAENFINLQDVHIYLVEKYSKQQNYFKDIINLLEDKINYMKNNSEKIIERNGEISLPFKNITLRNFSYKSRIDMQILYKFFMKMNPKEFGCVRFKETFETLNLNSSIIDDNNCYLSKLIFSFGIIKVVNITNIRYLLIFFIIFY
jgi:hypothetical protein